MNWWIRKLLNRGHNFSASSLNPEGLKARGSNETSRCPWELTGADDLKAVRIQSSLTLILSLEQETAPDDVPVFNYTLPQHRWLQCWGIKSIHITLWQVLGVKVISTSPTSSWKHELKKGDRRCQRAGRTIPLSSWQFLHPKLSFSLDHIKYWGKSVLWAFPKVVQ